MANESGKTKKRRRTPGEKTRQAARTETNKARRAKQRTKWLVKRRSALAARPSAAGDSRVRNHAWRVAAEQRGQIRNVFTDGTGKVTVQRRASVGLVKQRDHVPTQWRMPKGWMEVNG